MNEPRDLAAGMCAALKAIRTKAAGYVDPEQALRAIDDIAGRALAIAGDKNERSADPHEFLAALGINAEARPVRYVVDLGNIQVEADWTVWVNHETVECHGVDVSLRHGEKPLVTLVGLVPREQGEPDGDVHPGPHGCRPGSPPAVQAA